MSQPPPVLNYAASREGIREIAGRQRAIIFCILAYFLVIACQFALPEFRWILPFAAIAIGITSTVFVFLLCTKLYGAGMGIVLGVLTLIPCVGLITLLVVNARATAILKQAGLKVGLLGASVPK